MPAVKLSITFDLDINGYSEEGFRENPASAIRVMLQRANECLKDQNLIVSKGTVYTAMGVPVAHLTEDNAQ